MLYAYEPRAQSNPRRDREFENLLRRATRFFQSHENRGLKKATRKKSRAN